MTPQQVVSYARYLIDAYGDPKWADETVLAYVNEGVRSINHFLAFKKSNAILVKQQFNTVANQATYNLTGTNKIITADDFFRSYKLVCRDSVSGSATLPIGQNPEIPEVNAGDYYTKTMPWYYIDTVNSKLVIGPTPTEVHAMDLWYFKSLPELTLAGAAPTWLPSQYHEMLAFYAAVRMSEQDKQNADVVNAKYQQKFLDYQEYVFGNRVNEMVYVPAGELW